jgi:hypothetical protein
VPRAITRRTDGTVDHVGNGMTIMRDISSVYPSQCWTKNIAQGSTQLTPGYSKQAMMMRQRSQLRNKPVLCNEPTASNLVS